MAKRKLPRPSAKRHAEILDKCVNAWDERVKDEQKDHDDAIRAMRAEVKQAQEERDKFEKLGHEAVDEAEVAQKQFTLMELCRDEEIAAHAATKGLLAESQARTRIWRDMVYTLVNAMAKDMVEKEADE